MGQSSSNNSNTIEQQIDLVERLCELEEYSQAESYLQVLKKKDPKNPRIWYLLSFIATRQKQSDRAIELLKKAIEINPQEISFYTNLGNIYTNQQEFESAIKCYQTAITIQPENHELYKTIGFIYGIQGNMAAANFNYALAQQKKGNFSEAIKFYRKVIQVQPDSALAYYNLGYLYQSQKEIDLAIECYQQATTIKTDYLEAYSNLGYLFQEKGLLSSAIYNYEQVIRYKPNSGEAHLNLSVLYKKQGNLNQAFKACQKALQYQAEAANSFYPLNNIFLTTGNPQKRANQKNRKTIYQPPEQSQKQETVAKQNQAQKIVTQKSTEVIANLPAKTQTSVVVENKAKDLVTPKSTDRQSKLFNKYKNNYQYNSIYKNQSIFNYIEKDLIAHRILDNKYNFIVTTFFPQSHLKTAFLFLDYLSKTEFSYCLYQTFQMHQSSSLTGEIMSINHTKPNYFASVYNSIMGQALNYSRKTEFTHLLYLDYRLSFSLEPKTINLIHKLCERNVDFVTYNWLQDSVSPETHNHQIESSFLISSGAIQLYSLSKNSLLLWQAWQQAIKIYLANFDLQKSDVFPEDIAFLDYIWNNILRHKTNIRYAWLDRNHINYHWSPLAQNLFM